jgi:hypothetical protein
MMHISLDIKNESTTQKILDFLSSFQKEDVQIKTFDNSKKESLSSFAGMWKDRDIDINTIRESAWKK